MTKTSYSSFLTKPIANSFFMEKINEHEVFNEISQLKTNKAAGHDGIKPKIVKASLDSLARLQKFKHYRTESLK